MTYLEGIGVLALCYMVLKVLCTLAYAVALRKQWSLQRDVRHGEQVPRGYRIAWYDPIRQRSVAYPIGFHVVAWAIRYVWNLTYIQTRPDAFEKRCVELVSKEYHPHLQDARKQANLLAKEALAASAEAGHYKAMYESLTAERDTEHAGNATT